MKVLLLAGPACAGKVCTVAVRRGATATVQQLSWLLLTAPPPQPESSVFAMVEVPVAFWTAANAEGWAAWDVAVVMAAPMVRAIDAGQYGAVEAIPWRVVPTLLPAASAC